MWEVEVTDGEKWDGRESGDEEGKESFMTSRSLGEEIENWKVSFDHLFFGKC